MAIALMLRKMVKPILHALFLALAIVPAALSGFGRWRTIYSLFAQSYSLAPGIPGDYLRIAFYHLTLAQCPLSSRISFGSFFAHSDATLGPGVYIGSYCILGKTVIGERTQIASGVQVLSGRHQHKRGDKGEIRGSEEGEFSRITIGPNCWIGAAAIVMADVGEGSTIGAGSVVSRPIPAHAVAVGSPARMISSAEGALGA
jgi:acetyltransferase-like isoleucine patch superfamily enzyme